MEENTQAYPKSLSVDVRYYFDIEAGENHLDVIKEVMHRVTRSHQRADLIGAEFDGKEV